MPPRPDARWAELRALLQLSGPLVLAQLAQMAMGVVGTVAAGHLGVRALAAQALGATTFVLVLITAYGLMAGLDPHVSRAVGAGDRERAGHLVRQGLWLAAIGGGLLTLGLSAAPLLLAWMGQDPALLVDVRTFLLWSAPGLVPALLYSTYRSFFAAVGRPQVVMVAAIVANVLHALACWGLVQAGAGLRGIAIASVVCRVLMVAILAAYGRWHPQLAPYRKGFEAPQLPTVRTLLRSGVPLAVQYGLEVTGFVLITLWMGLLGENVLAAHEVALSVAAVAFQIPFALGTAAAMRVGQAVGRNDAEGVARAGWTAFQAGVAYTVLSGVVIVLLRSHLAHAYLPTATAPVLELTVHLLGIAAAFQLFDGTQAIGFGVLRGLDDTRVPLTFNLLGFALIGLPLGWVAVFVLKHPPDRLWWGLSLALGIVAVSLALRFRVLARRRVWAANADRANQPDALPKAA